MGHFRYCIGIFGFIINDEITGGLGPRSLVITIYYLIDKLELF